MVRENMRSPRAVLHLICKVGILQGGLVVLVLYFISICKVGILQGGLVGWWVGGLVGWWVAAVTAT